MTAPSDVTKLLRELGVRADAEDELLPLVYETLRSIAHAHLRKERLGHTLQATALVHEAYLRLARSRAIPWQGRAHFFRVSAEAMRRVLVDHARRNRSQKRGGGLCWVSLDALELAADDDADEVVVLDEALAVLEREDPRAAQVVKLRFYAGLGLDETAEALELSRRTVARDWAFARARLFELLGREPPAG